jgi:ubiquitin C-terminal hydrolase
MVAYRDKKLVLGIFAKFVEWKQVPEISKEVVVRLEQNPDWEACWAFFAKRCTVKILARPALDRLYQLLANDKRQFKITANYIQSVTAISKRINEQNGNIKSDGRTRRRTLVNVPLELDTLLFQGMLRAESDELAAIARDQLIKLYRAQENFGPIIRRFLEFWKWPGKKVRRFRIVRFLMDYCSQVEKNIGDLDFERHGQPLDLHGNAKVRFPFPNGVEADFTLSVPDHVSSQRLLLLVGPYLPRQALRYDLYRDSALVKRPMDLWNLPSRSTSTLQIREAQGHPSCLTPSTCLAGEGVILKLLQFLKDDHNRKFHELCQAFLNQLPTEPGFVEMSADCSQFCDYLGKVTNSNELKYFFDILRWRCKCSTYRRMYNASLLPTVINELLKRESTGPEVLNHLDEFQLPCNSLIAPAVLDYLRLPTVPEATKGAIADYIYRHNDALNLADLIDRIEQLVLKMSDSVWRRFWPVLQQHPGQAKVLFGMAERHMNHSYFRQIFDHYFESVLKSESPKDQLKLLIRLLRRAVTTKVADNLEKTVDRERHHLAKSAEELSELLDILSTQPMKDDSKRALYESAVVLAKLSPENREVLSKFIDRICHIRAGDRWNIASIETDRALAGMQNLTATCYMNSVLQQILRIPAFQFELSRIDSSHDQSIEALRQMLFSLMFSQRRVVDTGAFIGTWKGWGSQPVSAAEQQDANEFLVFLLDGWPDQLSSLFRGEITNICSFGNEITETVEPFWSVSLEVNGTSHLDDSLKAFASVKVSDQFIRDGDKLASARWTHRLKTLPPILVLQLRRFDFDFARLIRYKITNYFRFPEELELMETQYELNGCVLHKGDLQDGHYSSIVRIDGKWTKFDDLQVVEICFSELEFEAFGGPSVATSAYLLFYTRVGSGVLMKKPVEVPASLRDDNERFI